LAELAHPCGVMSGRSGFYAQVDDLVMARARRGDMQALESIYHTYEAPVYTLARRLCGHIEEADEVLQETFLEVVRSIGRYRGEAPFGAWLRRVAISKALQRLRRAQVRKIETDSGDPEPDVCRNVETKVNDDNRSSERIDLERALARLPYTARVVVWLYDVMGLSHPEIAELMGRSVSFSKSQLSRAHSQLRVWLGRYRSESYASDDQRAVGAARR
jgi:RNA polymerase sigma-70 factor (ECF subfamily)